MKTKNKNIFNNIFRRLLPVFPHLKFYNINDAISNCHFYSPSADASQTYVIAFFSYILRFFRSRAFLLRVPLVRTEKLPHHAQRRVKKKQSALNVVIKFIVKREQDLHA